MRSSSYGQSCLMRGAVDDKGITGTEGFRKFLRTRAAIVGQLVNYQDLALEAGVSGVTAKEELKVLWSMGIIQLLEPYSASGLKRLIRTPKLYFCDTGLCAYLCSWTGRDVLMHGAAGRTLLRKSGGWARFSPITPTAPENARFFFYRDKDQREIDLIVESNAVLHPLELKKGIRRNAR